MTSKEPEKEATSKPSGVLKLYLLAYNGLLTVGWAVILVRTVLYVVDHGASWVADGTVVTMPGLYDNLRWWLQVFQTAAFLEIVHAALGMVRSGLFTTLMQVFSRLFVLWGIMEGVTGVTSSTGVLLVSLAWSITEVVRYAFYFFALMGAVPYLIKWCRYTFFYILYPIGVLGELMLMFTALPVMQASQQWSLSLPNHYNMAFSYYYFTAFLMFLYIPLFPQLYGHMIQQRKKVIGTKTKEE